MDERGSSSDAAIAMLSVALDRDAQEPLVRQLYLRVRDLILSRQLNPGAKLPSTRKLSDDLAVSRTVTAEAFAQLAAEGFLESRQGSGHFVANLPVAIQEARREAAADAALAESQCSIWSARGMPFDPSWLGVDMFPVDQWARMTGRAWRRHQSQILERHWLGLPVLRSALADHLRALRGLALQPDQIMITAGGADALGLIARAARSDGGGPVQAWVEEPGLMSARYALTRGGASPIAVPVDAEGLKVREGQRIAPKAALAMVTATRQFPLGMPLSLPRRLALLEWSRRTGGIVVEDDYDGEIRFAGRPIQSLASLDPAAHVLTLGSFSKLTFPGLRLGYVAGSPELIARLAEVRREAHVLVPTAVQAAFAEFITTGAFARHLRGLRIQLTRRRQTLVEALTKEARDLLHILPQEVGMHLTVQLSERLAGRMTDVELAKRARTAGLVLLPLSQQYSERKRQQGFFLGYAGWSDDEMRGAIERFTNLLKSAADD